METAVRRWLARITPPANPIDHSLAPMVQLAFLLVLAILVILLPLSFVQPTTAILIPSILSSLTILGLIGLALVLLRRGDFQAAVTLFTTTLLLFMGYRLILVGLDRNPALLASLLIPMVCVGLLGQRRAILWIGSLSIGVLAASIVFAPTLNTVGSIQRSEYVRILQTFAGTVLFLGLILDRFGTALRTALLASLARERELAELHASLERLVDERTHDLAVAVTEAQTARVAADQANLLKSQFLANMSHELRTPLNAIINFAQFLANPEHGPLTDAQQHFQQRIHANGDHLLGLINDILDLSKIEAGKMRLHCEPTDLRLVLDGAIATTTALLREKDLSLTLEVPAVLPLMHIDKQRVRQVVLNLLSNAVKFTAEGEITVRVVATTTDLSIRVQDTGIGIAPDHQALIFEEFRQVEGDMMRSQQGTGLGLSISKRLIEMHGGRMWVESTLGVGSTFAFTLPLSAAPPPAVVPLRVPAAAPSDVSAARRIVVIDDDPDAQEILRTLLTGAGYQVQGILDSREALAVLEQQPPALILLDIHMPNLDGWGVLRQLSCRPQLAAIPVILCTVDERPSTQLRLVTTIAAYLQKPIDQTVLLPLIQQHVADAAAHILIVDDDADARDLLRQVLDDGSRTVTVAANGHEALHRMQEHTPSIVLLDLMMPAMDGFEVMRQMGEHALLRQVPVIVISARDLSAVEHQWLEQRTRACLSKPVAATEVVALVQTILHQR